MKHDMWYAFLTRSQQHLTGSASNFKFSSATCLKRCNKISVSIMVMMVCMASAEDNSKTHHCGKQRYRTSDILELHSEGLIMDKAS